MKRVVCCALCIIFLIASVSALVPTLAQKTLVPAAKTTPPLHVELRPGITVSPGVTSTGMGSLEIKSNPAGAEIWMFGNNSHYFTPFYSEAYPWTYYLSLKYPGYEPYTETVTVGPGQAVVVSATLVPLPVTTSPQAGQPSPTFPDNTPTNAPATPSPLSGQPTGSGAAVLSPDTTGSLSVTSTPAGAEVSLDNEVRGITPAMISGLSPGTHTLTITKAGYQNFTTTISIEAGKVREYSTGLSDAAPPAGTMAAKSPGFVLGAAFAAVVGIALVRKSAR